MAIIVAAVCALVGLYFYFKAEEAEYARQEALEESHNFRASLRVEERISNSLRCELDKLRKSLGEAQTPVAGIPTDVPIVGKKPKARKRKA